MRCKLCQSSTQTRRHEQLSFTTPSPFPLSGDITLAICQKCQFVASCSSNTVDGYADYYLNFNKHQTRDPQSALRDLDYFRSLLMFMESGTMTPFKNNTILDFGSGTTEFSRVALQEGARMVDNVDVGQDIPTKQYDWIVSTHCFEHLCDPLEDLKAVVRHLKSDGHLLLAVPDVTRYHDAYYGPWSHFDLEHINHFNLQSLTTLLELCDLDVVAHRRCDRMVGPRLAYPEVAVIGKAPTSESASAGANPAVEQCLTELFARYEADVELLLSAVDDIWMQAMTYSDFRRVRIGFYGLAPYAMRVIDILRDTRPQIPISFIADSDTRLTGREYSGLPILNKTQYEEFLRSSSQGGLLVVTLIAAINGYKILEMLQAEPPASRGMTFLLPPDCQNRQGSA